MMIILHTAPLAWQTISGPRSSVPGLVAAQNRLDGVEAGLAVTRARHGKAPEVGFPVFDRNTLLGNSGTLDLPAPFHRPDLAVFHDTYVPLHATIAGRLRKAAIPYILCPRGGLTRYAQAHGWWKKRIANLVFLNKLVAHAVALQCLTQGEAAASSRWNRPVFVVSNGVELPPESDLALQKPSEVGLRIVFMGRLDVSYKGLDMLLDACVLVRDKLRKAGARVELHGPDWKGSTKFLASRIGELGLAGVVALGGPVMGDAKRTLFRQADVFLHPSRSEGHPTAVLEALSYGVPCLLTPGTNMAEAVSSAGAGWEVEPSPAGIAAGIEKILQTERTRLPQAGVKARKLIARQFSWERIASSSVEAYRKYSVPRRWAA
jgi:glycosyltransferase involved in cell wall biosynthesis